MPRVSAVTNKIELPESVGWVIVILIGFALLGAAFYIPAQFSNWAVGMGLIGVILLVVGFLGLWKELKS